ncbi:MAG: hypothetical protein HFI95_15580 [Lachnospiraceae bacterium]|jgi:DNA-directed RNA polymerase specialized sigma subunit|nr:hypothetical protein [Lachnospiraceae bacterium]
MIMTKELLESYQSKKEEIAELHNALMHIATGETMIDNDTILDYRSGYPVPQAEVGVDWDKVFRTENRYKNKISVLKEECRKVEDFIENIPDSLTRRIFRMYYIQGMSQKEISRNVHLDRSSISKKISDYLNILQNMH